MISLPITIGVVNASIIYLSSSFPIGFICMIVIDMILVNFLAVFVYYNFVLSLVHAFFSIYLIVSSVENTVFFCNSYGNSLHEDKQSKTI